MSTPRPHNTPSIDLEDISSHWPPLPDFSNETPTQRKERLKRECEAERINDNIDAQIELEKSERRKRRPDFKILLLGQAESGKSTILRNFQLKYAPTAFHAEAEAWRAAIDLNLVRSVTFLLNLLEESSPIASNSTTDAASGGGGGSSSVDTGPPGDLRRLRVRLSPLRSIEGSLARSISPEHYPWPVGSVGSSSNSSKARGQGFEEVQRNARRVIEACREDIVALWNYPAVHASFADQSVSLECQSGFFLDAVDRITVPGYQPSLADIIKARTWTAKGIEEHVVRLETDQVDDSLAREHGQLWSFIEVGGRLALRAAWLPFFDDANMLLFIAPVSAFNQTLTEDRSVNCLWDSFLSWKLLCRHNLLKQATFVLLLNKYDLLDAKLRSGIQFRDYVTSYHDRANKTESVLEYLKGRFSAIYRQDPPKATLYLHITCATDPNSVSVVYTRVREVIFREHLKTSRLL